MTTRRALARRALAGRRNTQPHSALRTTPIPIGLTNSDDQTTYACTQAGQVPNGPQAYNSSISAPPIAPELELHAEQVPDVCQQALGQPFLAPVFMTLNNLAEQLPWLLRNPQVTHPTAGGGKPPPSLSAAASTTFSHSTTPLTASSFRKDVLPSGSTAVATPTPRAAAPLLPTPSSTATTLISSLRPTSVSNSNARDQRSPLVAANKGHTAARLPLPPRPSFLPSTVISMPSVIPNQQPQQQRQPPAPLCQDVPDARSGATPASVKSKSLAASSKTPSKTAAILSSHTKRARAQTVSSPYNLGFGSDIDLDDFDSVVDLTTDDNTLSSSSPNGTPRGDIQLWREDQALPSEILPKRSRKRKSGELASSPAKKKQGRGKEAGTIGEQDKLEDAEDEENRDSGTKFPDVNELLGFGLSSPITRRRTPATSPRKSPLKPSMLHTSSMATTPQKKQKRHSERSDVVMDSDDEFATPPTHNNSLIITCPDDSAMDRGDPPSPNSPAFRAASNVADLSRQAALENNGPKKTSVTKAKQPDGIGCIALESGDRDRLTVNNEPTAYDKKASDTEATGTIQTGAVRELEPTTADNGDEDAETTQRSGVLTFWPAVRWKEHCLDEKIRKNTADYMKALREKWAPARRIQIKGEKEPLLKEKQALDNLIEEFRSYARLYNDQEALLHTITQAYQNHLNTDAEECRLDELSLELQEKEDALRARLSDGAIDPTSCPSDFEAGSPHDVVVPATQHPQGFMTPILTRNNTIIPESSSQVVLQTQMPQPRQNNPPAGGIPTHSLPGMAGGSPQVANANNSVDYFDDDDIFTEMENLPPMFDASAGLAFGSARAPESAKSQSSRFHRRSPAAPPPTIRAQDLFSDFSDDVELLQVAEDFELQHSSGRETTTRQVASRSALAPTSGNAAGPAKTATLTTSKRSATASQKASISSELMRFEWSQDVRRALKDRFRMSGFRHNQLEAINATLSGKDAFVLMPTGGGKSLCYQLPAVVSTGKTHGVTIVISPLLSLMQDQVDHLKALNIAASSFNSSTPAAARKHVLALFSKPNPEHFLQLLYVTPEMVSKSNQFCQGLAALYRNKKLARIVIDEAHCVSQWGHDFRPDYKALGTVRQKFPDVPVMALTATATPNVIVDIKHNLSIDGCKVFSQSFNRPNLYYEIREKGRGCVESIAELISSQYSGQTGIVYTLSQKSTVSIAEKLRVKFGISAHHYHAAIGAEEKAQIQRDWQQGRIKVVVATIAFGMGIDKADVRFVIHHYLPKSLEGYYQETGRAGRDGAHSDCYLYFSYGDIKNLRKFISDSDASEEQKQRQREMLSRMVDFCENKRDCRRSEILRYFGEDFDKAGCDSTCDNCKSGGKFDLTDFTEYAVAALRVVEEYELITMVQCAEILQGRKRPQHESLEDVYGIAKKLKTHEIHMMIYRLLGEYALKEENRVNKMDIAIQYFSLGDCARDFFSGKKKLHVVIKVGGDIASAIAEKSAKNVKASNKSGEKADKPAKKGKATAKSKATDTTAAGPSIETSTKKKRKGVATVLDQAGASAEDGDEFDSETEQYRGPLHANGYAKDNFVVSDNEADLVDEYNDDAFESASEVSKRRPSRTRQAQLQQYAFEGRSQSRSLKKSQQSQRQRRFDELSGPIAQDSRLTEANIDPVHADIIHAFVDEARRLEEKIRNEKGVRIFFTESHLREMAIGWTDTLDKMRRIRNIDADHVQRYGAKFIPLVQRYLSMYQEMMGDGDVGAQSPLPGPVSAARSGCGIGASGSGSDDVVDLISSDDDNDDGEGHESGEGYESEEAGCSFGTASASRASAAETREAEQWRAQLETLQSQTGKSGGKVRSNSGSGGTRKKWGGGGGGGRRPFYHRGGSAGGRSVSGGGHRNRSVSSGGVAKRKAGGSSSAIAASRSGGSGRGSGVGGGGGSGRSGGTSGIGMMPL